MSTEAEMIKDHFQFQLSLLRLLDHQLETPSAAPSQQLENQMDEFRECLVSRQLHW
jgi:hypothetical protein